VVHGLTKEFEKYPDEHEQVEGAVEAKAAFM
jgi:hypothetical protein